MVDKTEAAADGRGSPVAGQILDRPPSAMGATLSFGSHLAITVALASYGVVALQAPFVARSPLGEAALCAVCFGGAGIWAMLATEHYLNELTSRRTRHRVAGALLSGLGLTLGVLAVFEVTQFHEQSRVAQACERLENLPDHQLARSGRCMYYFTTRNAAEWKLLGSSVPDASHTE